MPPRKQEPFPGSNLDAGILILFPPTRPRNEAIVQLGVREQLVERTHQDAKQFQPAAAEFLPNYAIHIVIEDQPKTGAFKCQRQSYSPSLSWPALPGWQRKVLHPHRALPDRALPAAPVQLDSRVARQAARVAARATPRAEPKPRAKPRTKPAAKMVRRGPQAATAAATAACGDASPAPDPAR